MTTNATGTSIMVNRWTDRVPHRNYKAACGAMERWNLEGVEVLITMHGSKDERPTSDESRTLDWRSQTDGKFPRLMRLCFKEAILRGYKQVCLCDDDGWYFNLERFKHVTSDAYQKNYGAYGPMTDYVAWTKWDAFKVEGKVLDYKPVVPSMFSTHGSQVYNVHSLEETEEVWDEMLLKLNFRCDFQMFMLIEALGMGIMETWMGFRHEGASGFNNVKTPEAWEAWRNLRMKEIDEDVATSLKYLKGVSRRVEERVDKIMGRERKYVIARCQKAGVM